MCDHGRGTAERENCVRSGDLELALRILMGCGVGGLRRRTLESARTPMEHRSKPASPADGIWNGVEEWLRRPCLRYREAGGGEFPDPEAYWLPPLHPLQLFSPLQALRALFFPTGVVDVDASARGRGSSPHFGRARRWIAVGALESKIRVWVRAGELEETEEASKADGRIDVGVLNGSKSSVEGLPRRNDVFQQIHFQAHVKVELYNTPLATETLTSGGDKGGIRRPNAGQLPPKETLDAVLRVFCGKIADWIQWPHEKQYDASHIHWWFSHLLRDEARAAVFLAFQNAHENMPVQTFLLPANLRGVEAVPPGVCGGQWLGSTNPAALWRLLPLSGWILDVEEASNFLNAILQLVTGIRSHSSKLAISSV
ncbi:hypothetical protein FA13DRAFT_1704308 [Coprinellus micaceus]|uniref:Uncharacterized protein n=1 Tax=Coprinellus micaceus TaxID=71717 RepID=A0A4Y7U1V8_COPMI|nr:hypothetical protein FA13DRAFT_1704308 [Coprinellus micaceus]